MKPNEMKFNCSNLTFELPNIDRISRSVSHLSQSASSLDFVISLNKFDRPSLSSPSAVSGGSAGDSYRGG